MFVFDFFSEQTIFLLTSVNIEIRKKEGLERALHREKGEK